MYSTQVLDHFEHPRNSGTIAAPDASVRMENPACGDILELSLKTSGDSIEEIRFRAKGCVASIACASALTELVKGKRIEEARQISREQLINSLNGLPPASTHAAHLALEALASAIHQLDGRH